MSSTNFSSIVLIAAFGVKASLSIAVGILSAQSTLASEKKISLSSDRKSFSLQNALSATATTSHDRVHLNRSGPRTSIGMKEYHLAGASSSASRSLSRALEEDSTLVECNPEATAEARAAADVGVLECGYDEICVENVESSIGGFCYETYGVSKVCDPLSVDYDAACDCSDFDVPTKTGSISCPESSSYGIYNMGSSYYGCYGVSKQINLLFSLKDNMYISRGSCTELFVGDDATNSTKLCVMLDMVNGDLFRFNGTYCELQINGQACASCTFTMDFSEWPLSSQVLEQKADCSNVVDDLLIDNLESLDHLPIIQDCHKPIDGTSCSLCADNEYISLANKAAISLDGFGSDFTCAGLYEASWANRLSSDKCVEATVLAKNQCCKAKSSETSALTASSLVSAGILLIGTSFMLAMN